MIFLGIDCGTQSTRVIALDWESGRILASGGGEYGFVEGLPEGAFEQDPAWWVAAADAGMRATLGALGTRWNEVAGIGVSGQQHGLVLVDPAGRVLRPAKLWCDTSTTAECEEMTGRLGGTAAAIDAVGNTIRTGYTAPKILWTVTHEPHVWEKTATVLLPHDYLNFWLTGEKRMEYGDASGTALLDVRHRQWSARAVESVASGLAEKLPPVGSSAVPCGRLREDLRRAWGLPKAPVVSAGSGDNMMAAIGTGNVAAGEVTVSLGTSGTIFACCENPVVDPAGEVAAFCDSTDRWLPLVCALNLTLVTEQVRRLFGWSHEQMDAAVVGEPAGAGGLVFLPYLMGERTPDLPSARGALTGISLANLTPAKLARASIEAVLLGLGYGLKKFRELGVPVGNIRLTGGASASPVWRQLCADIFGAPTMGLDDSAGAALGAAIQAGWTCDGGGLEALTAHCRRLIRHDPARQDEPDAGRSAIYQDMLATSGCLREALRETGFLG